MYKYKYRGNCTRSNPMNTWWRHQMGTFPRNWICAGNSPVPGEFPAQRPVTRSFGVFFDMRLNKRLSKQSWGWWFDTLSRPLWRHCNDLCRYRLGCSLCQCQKYGKIFTGPTYKLLLRFTGISYVYRSLIPHELHILSNVLFSGFQSSRELWNPLRKAVPGKFHGSDRHSKATVYKTETIFTGLGHRKVS